MRSIEILLVEDNPGDIRLTREALKESKLVNNLSIVTDGNEAMSFLRKKEEYSSAPTPDLILLDINLPKKNGLEVLTEIKTDETLKVIPVVILTTSQSDRDILKSYEAHVNCYISKPVEFNSFMEVIKQIEGFWLTIVSLPANK